jgi:phytoene/squalene synthetase
LETMMATLTLDLVEDAARTQPDRTLATSFISPDARARVIALILFSHEIGRACAVVSEPRLAAIRLQWWRDTIEQIYAGGTIRAQPVAVALGATIQEAGLPRPYFDAMIDGHELELDATPFSTWADLDAYLDATQGNLNRLSLLASGIASITTPIDQAARQAGIAWGLSALMGAMPQWCIRRCSWLPSEVRDRLDLDSLYSGQVTSSVQAALVDVLKRIKMARKATNVALASAQIGASFPVLAHACLAQRYGQANVPKADRPWSQPSEVSLLERQLRITVSVARARV